MHSPSSATRDRVVASAAPRASIRGAPSRPKMNTAFSRMFSTTAVLEIQAPGAACSVTFMVAR